MTAPTKQEIFNTVVKGLRAQGCKSENDAGCAYRGIEGRRCAAGFLIPDDKYSTKFEHQGIMWEPYLDGGYNRPTNCLISMGYDKELLKFTTALQGIHDDKGVEEWEEEWQQLARENGLELP